MPTFKQERGIVWGECTKRAFKGNTERSGAVVHYSTVIDKVDSGAYIEKLTEHATGLLAKGTKYYIVQSMESESQVCLMLVSSRNGFTLEKGGVVAKGEA